MKQLAAIVFLLLLTACAGGLPTSVGIYGNQPVAQNISGSNAQAIKTRTVEYTGAETFQAAKTALLRLGYNVEVRDEKRHMVTANGAYGCGGAATAVTMAVYVQQLNTKPETKFTVIVDRWSWTCWGGGEHNLAASIAKEMQQILSTY